MSYPGATGWPTAAADVTAARRVLTVDRRVDARVVACDGGVSFVIALGIACAIVGVTAVRASVKDRLRLIFFASFG